MCEPVLPAANSRHLLSALTQRASPGLWNVLWDTHVQKYQDHFSSNVLGRHFSEGDCLGVAGSIIHDDKDVFMSPGRFQQGTHQIYAHSLEGNFDDG